MPYAGIGPDKKAQQFSGRVLTYLGVVYDLRPECAVYVAWWFKTPKDDPKTIVTAEKFQIGAGLSGYVAELAAAQICAVKGVPPTTHAGLSFVLGAILELCSLTLLAYVPYTVETKEGA